MLPHSLSLSTHTHTHTHTHTPLMFHTNLLTTVEFEDKVETGLQQQHKFVGLKFTTLQTTTLLQGLVLKTWQFNEKCD